LKAPSVSASASTLLGLRLPTWQRQRPKIFSTHQPTLTGLPPLCAG
jgi:hypothetical protein